MKIYLNNLCFPVTTKPVTEILTKNVLYKSASHHSLLSICNSHLESDVPCAADVVDEDVGVVLVLVKGSAAALTDTTVFAQDVRMTFKNSAHGFNSHFVAALHFCSK
jgi:hypothetical protein